jgi:hypothetical protein
MNSSNSFALVVDEWFDGEQRHPGRSTMKIVDGRLADVAYSWPRRSWLEKSRAA